MLFVTMSLSPGPCVIHFSYGVPGLVQTHIDLLAVIRPRAESHSADLRVERPQVKIQLAEPDELRGRHP